MELKKGKSINVSDLVAKLTKNLTWLFFAIFFILLLVEAFEVKHSVGLFLDADQVPPLVGQEKGPRINFDNYNEIVKRIQDSKSFTATTSTTTDPFSQSQ